MSQAAPPTALRSLSAPTVGYVAVGISAFALLAAGPRVLGQDAYSDLAVAWTVSTVFGFGVAVPGEQTVVRGVAGGSAGAVTRHVLFRLLLATTPILVCAAFAVAGVDLLGVEAPIWWLATAVAAIGWAVLMGPRGSLAGRGNFAAFGVVLIVEAVGRVALVAGAMVAPRGSDGSTWLLAAAVGLPLLVAAGAAVVLGRRALASAQAQDAAPSLSLSAAPVPQPVVTHGTAGEQSSLTALALAMQVLLNSAPLWLSARPEVSAATAGLYVSVTSYMRIPALFTGGALAVVLSRASSMHSDGDRGALRGMLAYHLRVIGGLTSALTLLLILAAPVGLAVLYGRGTHVGWLVLVVIGVATVLFSLGNLATSALIGMRRSGAAAAVWVLAAVCATAGLAVVPPTLIGASWAVLVGVVVGCVGAAVVLIRGLAPTSQEEPA